MCKEQLPIIFRVEHKTDFMHPIDTWHITDKQTLVNIFIIIIEFVYTSRAYTMDVTVDEIIVVSIGMFLHLPELVRMALEMYLI